MIMSYIVLLNNYAVRRFSPKKFGKPLFTFVYGTNRILTRVSRLPVGFLVYPLFPAVFHRRGQCLLVKFPLPGQFPELFSWSSLHRRSEAIKNVQNIRTLPALRKTRDLWSPASIQWSRPWKLWLALSISNLTENPLSFSISLIERYALLSISLGFILESSSRAA